MTKEIQYLKLVFLSFIIGLTILLGISLVWNIRNEYYSVDEYAKIAAQTSYNKDLLYRRWAAMHGGVYVPITSTTPPNPYLDVPDREIVTENGKKLTLINPAYMTRQVFSLAEEQNGVKGHITSLKPIRPENKADEWETMVLQKFDKGILEYSSLEKINGKAYMRYMHVMKVEQSCLSCHSKQGYKLDDVRGGISVSVPMEIYNQVAINEIRNLIIIHLTIYLIILIIALFSYQRSTKEILMRLSIQQKIIQREADLQRQNKEFELLNEGYKIQNEELLISKEKAEESELQQKALLDNAIFPVNIVSVDGKLIYMNEASCNLFGFKREEIEKYSVIDFWRYPAERDIFIERLKKEGSILNFETDYLTIDKGIRTVLVSSRIITYKRQKVFFSIYHDITERKKLEDSLLIAKETIEESELKYKAAFFTSPDCINITKLNGEYVDINEGFTKLSGFTKEDTRGRTASELKIWAIPEDRIKMVDNLQKYGIIENLESLFKTKNGTLVYMLVSAKIIKIKNEPHILSISRNITERKEIEQELIRSKEKAEENDRLKSAFLANISHEIRTPMNGILGFSELLKDPKLSGEEQKEYISVIEQSGKRMLNIIHDIVDISKIESGQMSVNVGATNLNEQLEFIYNFFNPEAEAKEINLSFISFFPSQKSIINTDSEKVYAILTNLLKNAVKYTDHGSIEFGYHLRPDAKVIQGLDPLNAECEFFVKDTGIGIPKERQTAIFERFIQAEIGDRRAYQGAGLGLAITKSYVEMLGGRIWVESEEGIGSTFYFTLPYNGMHIEKIISDELVSKSDTINKIKPLRILIAEDDRLSAKFIEIKFKKYIQKILTVTTGTDAVETFHNNPEIDLILMDIKMPGMNGYEAALQIRQFNQDVIIIAQTAFALAGDRELALAAGCNDYISKPINADQLMGLIEKYFSC